MPTYTMINNKTGEETDMILSFAEREELLAEGQYTQKLSTGKLVTSVKGTLSMTSDGWKDHLKQIKKTSGRDNTINI